MSRVSSSPGLVRRLNASTRVRADALNVTPDLLGVPLAPLGRRAIAMGIDLGAIALISSTGSFWIAAGIAALVYQLRHRQGERSRLRSAWMWLVLALLVFVGAQRATTAVERWTASPQELAALAVQDADDDDDDDVARAATAQRAAALAASTAAPAAAVLQPSGALQQAPAAARIAQLETELAEARKPRPVVWRDDLRKIVHAIGVRFGWAVAYFTLLPFWWKGQTLGKRLMGLRVVELTGKPLNLMASFGRYGGYAAGMATGGAGFAQVMWDPNRQAIHDKIAHTVVVDLREPRAALVPLVANDASAPQALPAATVEPVALESAMKESV